jgi:hypothetical protein
VIHCLMPGRPPGSCLLYSSACCVSRSCTATNTAQATKTLSASACMLGEQVNLCLSLCLCRLEVLGSRSQPELLCCALAVPGGACPGLMCIWAAAVAIKVCQ